MIHKSISQSWYTFSLCEQMANIGSEIERALSWKKKQNSLYSQHAHARALELFDLTLSDPKLQDRQKEITLAKTLWIDYFSGKNTYNQTEHQWKSYMLQFAIKAQNEKRAP